jgi:hypothetical protein
MRGPSCLVSTPAGLSLVYSPGLPPAAAARSRARACPHSSVPALAIGEREDTLGPSTMPALSSPRGPMVDGSCVRFRSGPPGGSPPGLLSPSDSAACLRLLRPGCQPPRHLADCRISRRRHMGHCADRTCTCKYNSSSRCAPSRGSLGSHFPTFRGTRRRYDCHLTLAEFFACHSFPDTLRASLVRGLPAGLVAWSTRPAHARAFGHPVPQSGPVPRSQRALPSSRVPPVPTCPARRVEIRRAQP